MGGFIDNFKRNVKERRERREVSIVNKAEQLKTLAAKEIEKQQRVTQVRAVQLKRAQIEAKILQAKAQQVKAKRQIAGGSFGPRQGIGQVQQGFRQAAAPRTNLGGVMLDITPRKKKMEKSNMGIGTKYRVL